MRKNSQLREKGLGVQCHYIPVYFQPYYQDMGYKKGVCSVGEDFYQREISIPMYPIMKTSEIRSVIQALEATFKVI
jgi:dTDP-4-amino-4,6-dideoxygalactose transaminase